jgi:HEAT repeat protein
MKPVKPMRHRWLLAMLLSVVGLAGCQSLPSSFVALEQALSPSSGGYATTEPIPEDHVTAKETVADNKTVSEKETVTAPDGTPAITVDGASTPSATDAAAPSRNDSAQAASSNTTAAASGTPRNSSAESTSTTANRPDEARSATDGSAALPAIDPELQASFERWLDTDGWQRDLSWSALRPTDRLSRQRPLARRWEWRFAPAEPNHVLPMSPSPTDAASAVVATSSTTSGDRNANTAVHRWEGVWSGDATRLVAAERDAIVALLEQLAQRTDRVGRQARLLAARLHDPPRWVVDWDVEAAVAGKPSSPATAAELPASSTSETSRPGGSGDPETRAATAEIWCAVLLSQPGDAETRLAPPGRLLRNAGLPEHIRATLWHQLAQQIWPDRLPGLAAVLAADDAPLEARQAALEACVIHAEELTTAWQRQSSSASAAAPPIPIELSANAGIRSQAVASARSAEGVPVTGSLASRPALPLDHWPHAIWSARFVADSRTQQLLGRWAALVQHPDALALLRRQLRDTLPGVSSSALESLALLPDMAARDELRSWANNQDNEVTQAIAVRALSQFGLPELLRFEQSPSPKVRQVVAQQLLTEPSAATARALAALLADRSLDVQQAALVTVRQGPLEWSQPLLLEAIRNGSLRTRQQAMHALRDIRGPQLTFPIEADAATRSAAVQQWATQSGVTLSSWTIASAIDQQRSNAETDRQRRARLQQALHIWTTALVDQPLSSDQEAAWETLLTAAPADADWIERELAQMTPSTGDRVSNLLLPQIHPGYRELAALRHHDVQHRRAAAQRLWQISQQVSLPEGLVRRLAEPLTREQDQLVWQACLQALSQESHESATYVALLALQQPWPDLRRMGAEYFLQHPDPEAALWLLPLLGSSPRNVQQLAMQALAQCGNPQALDGLPATEDRLPLPGLRPWLTSTDAELRWTALQAMVQLRDPQACEELLRLSFSSDVSQRQAVAIAMGASGQTRFVEPLIRWSWTETADPVKLALLRSLDQLVLPADQPARPDGLAAPLSIDDNIKRWTLWWHAQSPRRQPQTADPATASTAPPPAPVTLVPALQ